MQTEQRYGFTLSYDDSPEAQKRVYEIALKWFKKLDHYSGESLAQSDDTYEHAPEILAELAEAGFNFKQKWDSDDEE